jgi:NAD-dependent deacetylase
MTLEAAIHEAARILRRARQLVILTGAGVSKESGVPTFRDALEGMWERFNPEDLATPEAFLRNPALVWEWYEHRRQMLAQVQPNPGHYALAALEGLLPEVIVVTQNVDGLHRAAGSTDVIELHGNLARHKCFDNCQGDPTLIDLSMLPAQPEIATLPPRCPHCGAFIRPDVVWFTESLPPLAIDRAFGLAQTCDVMLVVGTSGVVQPAASLPFYAKSMGDATIIDVNPLPDEIAPLAHVFIQGPSGVVLPQVVQAVRELT